MVAAIDDTFEYTSRSFYVLEVYAAVVGEATLICDQVGCLSSYVQKRLQHRPLQSQLATTRDERDKKLIDNFIKEHVGFDNLDRIVTQAVINGSHQVEQLLGVVDLDVIETVNLGTKRKVSRSSSDQASEVWTSQD